MERLRDELAATNNIIVAIIRTTVVERHEVERIIVDAAEETIRLDGLVVD